MKFEYSIVLLMVSMLTVLALPNSHVAKDAPAGNSKGSNGTADEDGESFEDFFNSVMLIVQDPAIQKEIIGLIYKTTAIELTEADFKAIIAYFEGVVHDPMVQDILGLYENEDSLVCFDEGMTGLVEKCKAVKK